MMCDSKKTATILSIAIKNIDKFYITYIMMALMYNDSRLLIVLLTNWD